MCYDVVSGFHQNDQEELSEDLKLGISTDEFLNKHQDLILKYERQSNPDWGHEQERTAATKINSFWQKLDDDDADRYITFLNGALDEIGSVCKRCL